MVDYFQYGPLMKINIKYAYKFFMNKALQDRTSVKPVDIYPTTRSAKSQWPQFAFMVCDNTY